MKELEDVNIRHFKLISGDNLIAIVLTEKEAGPENYSKNLIVVQSPMEIQMVRTDTAISFGFYEWQPLAKSDICFINPTHVISHVECSNDVKEQYINTCVNSSYDDDLNFDDYGDEDADTADETTPTPTTYH